MGNFESDLMQSVRNRVIAEISKTDFIKNDFSNQRVLPREFINKVWDAVDWDTVVSNVKDNLETRICNSIVASMETEIKTDIKSLLSVDGVRQKLRIEVYPKLMKVLNEAD